MVHTQTKFAQEEYYTDLSSWGPCLHPEEVETRCIAEQYSPHAMLYPSRRLKGCRRPPTATAVLQRPLILENVVETDGTVAKMHGTKLIMNLGTVPTSAEELLSWRP